MELSELVYKVTQLWVYIYVMLAMGCFLVIFGSSRRRYDNGFLRMMIRTANNLSLSIIFIITAQMVSYSTSCDFLYPVMAVYLVMFYGMSDCMTANTLEDNYQWNILHLIVFNVFGMLAWVYLVGRRSESHEIVPAPTWVSIVFLTCVCYYRAVERIQALKKACKNGLAVDSKPVSDFMGCKHELCEIEAETETETGADTATAEYHNYLVTTTRAPKRKIDISSDKVITVGKVWNCQGRLLSAAGDPDSKMKDLCLSFSMYNLLCCHFAGYIFPQSARDRRWEFCQNFLLDGDVAAGENYRRPFRLIEQELGFLYDHLYTKNAILFQRRRHVAKIFLFFFVATISIVYIEIFFLNRSENLAEMNMDNESMREVYDYILITRIIIGVFLCLEALQVLAFTFSNWGKLSLLCKYVGQPLWRRSKLLEKIVQVVCKFPSFKLWGRKLGQYSFLESFNKSPPWWTYNYFSKFVLLESDPGKGHGGKRFVPLSPQVQRAVLVWIKQNGGRSTKGRESLVDNRVLNPELLSACEFQETTRVIMIWHIATCLCEIRHGKLDKFAVPVVLSKYCAYLVVFVPSLLPDHYVQTTEIFDSIVSGAEQLLKGCESMEDKYDKIMSFAETSQSFPANVIAAGGWVAKLLMEEGGDDVDRLWKILADFWTEMMLFVAPSGYLWSHALFLAEGGEFLTHLMALLFHAGITADRDFTQPALIV